MEVTFVSFQDGLYIFTFNYVRIISVQFNYRNNRKVKLLLSTTDYKTGVPNG